MEIINNFGFEPTFFIAQIINFLILAFIFKRFLYKPILKVLHDRETKIAQGLKDAESAQKALAAAESEKNEIIKAAALEAGKIIEETKNSAIVLREKLTSDAKSDAAKIIKDAKEIVEIEFQKARLDATNMALDLSKKILEKILSEIFTKDEKQKIMERNLKLIKNYE